MKKRANTSKPKSHARAPGQTQASISLDEEILKLGKAMASEDDRTFSNFVERLIKEAAKASGKLSSVLI